LLTFSRDGEHTMAIDSFTDASCDSKPVSLDDLLLEKLEMALDKPTQAVVVHDVAKIAADHSAVDLAFAASRLPPYARAVLFQNFTSIKEQINFLINTDSSTRILVFREITDEEIVKVIGQMPPDEAVEVLEDLSDRRCRKVIENLEPSKALRIQEIEKKCPQHGGSADDQ
jgi:magnesium transporter